MIRSTLYALSLLGLTSTLAIAAPIPLGTLGDFSVFSADGVVYNNNYSSSNTTTINDGLNVGSRFSFGGSDNIQYIGGGVFQSITYGGTEYNEFHALTATLVGLSSTPIVSWSGLTPGNYTFTDSTLPSTVSLTEAGTYVFSYVGSSPLALTGTNITLGSGLSSDDVFWYVPVDFSLTNGTFGGVLVVDGFGASIQANGSPLMIQGRVLAESNVQLIAWNGGDLSFNTQFSENGSEVPEPSSFLLVVPALAVCAIARRRLSMRERSAKG